MLNIMGALFVATIFIGTSNSSTVQPVVAIERTVMYRWAAHHLPAHWCVVLKCTRTHTRVPVSTRAERGEAGSGMRGTAGLACTCP